MNIELSKVSAEVWNQFEEEFGVDIQFRQIGYLFLAREEETAVGFREDVALQNDLGVKSEIVNPEDMTDYCASLKSDLFELGTYCPTDGFADPHLALQGYAQAAQDVGAEIRTKTAVTNILQEGDAVDGVDTEDATLNADFVVNTAGAWAGRVAEFADVSIPVAPRRRQCSIINPEIPVPETDPYAIDLDTGAYFRPEREGAAVAGGHFANHDPDVHPDAYSKQVDLEWMATVIEHISDYSTYFGLDSEMKRGWSGLYAVTPDHHPIIEETIPGFINAVGFSGHGFQHAPATGQVVSDLVNSGKTDLVDISSLESVRFNKGNLIVEKNVA